MWSIDYVQVPDEDSTNTSVQKSPVESKSPKSPKPSNEPAVKTTPIHHRLVKQINVSSDSTGLYLMKSGSESSLSEDNTRRSSVDRQRSNESSNKEWRSEQQDEKETCSDTEDITPPVAPARRRRSRVHVSFRKSEGW